MELDMFTFANERADGRADGSRRSGPRLPLLALVVPVALGTALGQGPESGAETGPPPSLSADTSVADLDELIAEALGNNPGIKAARFQVQALHSTPDHVWHLMPPQIGVELFQAPVSSFPNPFKNQMEVDYSLQQAFPFPGKIASMVKVEHSHARMGEAQFWALKRKLIKDVKIRYYELYLLDRRLDFNREDQALMNRFIDIARRQYEVGMGRQAEILRAQTELTKLRVDSISLAQTRRSMEGMLNALLNRKTSGNLRVAKSLSAERIEWSLDQVEPLLKEYHPELQAMRASVDIREAERIRARKEFLPEFMVRGMYKDMLETDPAAHGGPPEDYWSVMVSMDIPFAFWSAPRFKAGMTRSRAALNQARQEYSDMENMTTARAQEALLKARSSAELARISRTTLLPQAQQALESNLSAYQGGRGEFMMLLDSYRMRLMARQDSEMTLMQVLVSQAELEEAIGLDLGDIQGRLSGGKEK